MIIATAQSEVKSSVHENGIEIRRLIKVAKDKGASLVHFCEGALSGYAKQQVKGWRDFDTDQIKEELRLIQASCKQLGIYAVIGSAHQLSQGNKPHNSLYIISSDGEIINRYDKRKCSQSEIDNWYTPGFDTCEFHISDIKFSCALCIEIQFPEIFIEAGQRNVDCLLFSTYSKERMFGIQAQGYAATNNYWISMSVPANESAQQTSQFIGPTGEVIGQCERNMSSVEVFEINKDGERWHTALKLAKPWRRLAREGTLYEQHRVNDVRSEMKTIV